MLTTATIDILSALGATLKWESTGSIGSIYIDEASTLYVKANLSTSSFALKYKFAAGNLPPGLTLNFDGTLQGKPTSFSQNTYTFLVSVTDPTGYEFISNEEFTLKTKLITTSTNYTTTYFRTYPSLEKRKEYNQFINNKEIFLPELIYRPYDKNFGVQQDLKMILHHGVEVANLNEYQTEMEENFSRRNIKIGDLKVAVAIEDGKKLYEVIYLDIIDDFKSNNTATSFVFNGRTYYPPSINNMRSRFKYSSTLQTTEILNPKFTKNAQPTTLKILGFIPFIPICYCVPEKGLILMKKIKDSGFNFNKIHFDVDRLLIEKSSSSAQDKYLLFKYRN